MRSGSSSRRSIPLQHRWLFGSGASCFLATALACSVAFAAAPVELGTPHISTDVPADGSVKLARYSTAAAEPLPNADDPLSVIAHVQFPRARIATVGQAVRYLLLRTGYSLVDTSLLDPAAAHVLTLPLPESDRELGTYRVRAMLAVLIGKPFAVKTNPVNRTVSFVPVSDAMAAIEGSHP